MTDLYPTLTYGSLDLTAHPYLWEFGGDFGAPENASEVILSALQDGDLEVSDRAGNRTIALSILVDDADLAALAEAEAALELECRKERNELTIDPGDGYAAPTVFTTFRAQLTLVRDDDHERNTLRRYSLVMRALPHGHSVDEVVVPALAASGTTTTDLDTMGATTGWAGFVDGVSATVTNDAGPPTTNSVSKASPTASAYVLALRKTFAATTTVTNLLVVDWKPSLGGGTLTATGDGVSLPLVSEGASPTAGYIRSYFEVAAASLAVTQFDWAVTRPISSAGPAPALTLTLDNVAVTDVRPFFGTGRQQLRTLDLHGSARAQGSLAIESETASLGSALIYTYPADELTNGYTPSLRSFRSAGNTVTADSTTVSGFREPIDGSGVTLRVPYRQFPRGQCILIARISGGLLTPTTPFTWTQSTMLGANTLDTSMGDSSPFTLTTDYELYVLGRILLPAVDVDPFSSAELVLNIVATAGVPLFDEAWLFNQSIGQLTWVDCGSGTAAVGGPAKRLYLDSPTVDTPMPTIRMGHSADRSDAYHPVGAVQAWDTAEFVPPRLNVFTVTTNADDADVSLRYAPAWHTHAAI